MRYLCKTQLPEIDRLQFVSFHNPQRFGISIYLFFTHLFTFVCFRHTMARAAVWRSCAVPCGTSVCRGYGN